MRRWLIASLAFALATPFADVEAQAGARKAQDDLPLLEKAGTARTIGTDTARVIVIEFIDYACPVCAAFHAQRSDSLKRLAGPDVQIVMLNFPLQNHLRSVHGSEAAMCAGVVGGRAGFTAVADRLYRRQAEWSEASDPAAAFTRYAKEAGLDTVAFSDCRSRDLPSPLILADLETATKFGIDGTPTFIIVPRGAGSAQDTFRTGGNATIASLLDLIGKAREKSK